MHDRLQAWRAAASTVAVEGRAGIVEDWPDDPQTHMPVGIAVSMGARIELLAPDKSITGTPQSRSGSSDT
jgi:hypothetical protein